MRLETISLRNFRKISEAALEGLPEEGLIAVAGPNESGKTSLAEAVGFAFYGRSIRGDCSAEDLIQWGQDRLEVEVGFRVGSARYVVRREIDRLGSHLVTLRELANGEKTAGLSAVESKLRDLGLMKFRVFRYLIYFHRTLEDEELRNDLLAEVTGIKILSQAADALREEIKGREKEYSVLVQEIERKEQQAERYKVISQNLEETESHTGKRRREFDSVQTASSSANTLWRKRRRLADRWQRHANRLANLSSTDLNAVRAAVERCEELLAKEREENVCPQDAEPLVSVKRVTEKLREFLTRFDDEVVSAEEARRRQLKLLDEEQGKAAEWERWVEGRKRKKRRAAVITFAAGLAAAGAAAVLYYLTKGDFAEFELDRNVTAALAVGGLASVIGLVSFFVFLTHTVRLERGRREANRSAAAARDLEKATADLDDLLERAHDSTRWLEVLDRLGGESGLEKPASLFSSLAEEVRKLAQKRREEAAEADTAYRSAQEELRKARSARDRAESELREKRNATEKLAELEEETSRLKTDLAAKETALEDHLLALELIEATIAAIRLRSVPALNEALRLIIGPVTGGSYREVRLSEGLRPEIFATLKGDFLSPSELSGAVRSGVEVAVAAAMASLFSRSRYPDGQFLLLDYSFSLFDEERLKKVLNGMSSLPGLPQVFCFLQHVPEEVPFAAVWRIEEGKVRREGAPEPSPAGEEFRETPWGEG